MEKHELIQINVRQVLAGKLGHKAKLVPGFVVRWLERTLHQDELNEKLRLYYPKRGAEFCQTMIDDFGVTVDVRNADKFPSFDKRRVIFVCNHPLGGFDGVVLIDQLTRRYGNGVRVVVNDLLMALDPLDGVFLPINKHGKQSRDAISAINDAMEGPDPILIFPAGLVSRRGKKGVIRDLQWHKMFVSKAVQYERDVVPLHFDGHNSPFFYKLAQWRKRLGIKFNIEMLYLPQEMLACQGKHFEISVGDRIPWQSLNDGDALSMAQHVKELTYSLPI